jgi:hypothetical protein
MRRFARRTTVVAYERGERAMCRLPVARKKSIHAELSARINVAGANRYAASRPASGAAVSDQRPRSAAARG